ncbi:MAG TPA: protein phosphatase 2C domain-containing protein [Actinospica sp.]|jgi:protein phosphatase|nr:protein phosphatase 2C domain-containing protein [Actinospica sp.]
MSLSLRYAARSHVGLIRDGNEDSGYASARLLVIADGMGGQAAGEIASAVAVETLAELDSPHTTGLSGDPVRDLDDRIKLANNKIRAIIAQRPELEGMGTTCTALFLAGGSHFAFAHIGDSRAYRLRGGVLEQISTDHTWVQRLIDEGQITPEEAERHPQRSLLMRALGTTAEVDLDLTVLDVQEGDRYLLCSDGLSGFAPFNTLASTLAGYGDPHHAAETLIQHALRGGGADNITCIVADAFEQAPQGARPPSQAETQYLELPVVVGAAAENQANGTTSYAQAASEQPGANPADPGVTGMMNAGAILAAAETPGQSPAQPDAPVLPAPTVGGADTAEMEAVSGDEPRRRRWLKPAIIGGTAVVVLAGLAAGGFYYTQQQYYVAADGSGHVAIYQGVDYSLAGIKLSHVYTSADVLVSGLPTSEQDKVDSSITATSLTDAKTIVSTLSIMESECAAITAAPTVTASSTPSASATPTGSATPNSTGTSTAKASDKASGTASGKASTSSSAHPSTNTSPTTSPTPTPSVSPSSSVSSGNTVLGQLSAECPVNAG